MGENANLMLDGTLCQSCGEYIDSKTPPQGIPRWCWSCMPDKIKEKIKNKAKSPTGNPKYKKVKRKSR